MRSADDADFTEFVAGSSRRLLGLAYLLTASTEAAEDLLQVTLDRTYRHWRRLNREGVPQVYARRVLVKTATTRWRHHRGMAGPDVGGVRPAEAAAEEGEVRPALMRAIAALPAGQRAVLALRYFEGLTDTQAAAVMGCSVGTVKSQLTRAIAQLRMLVPSGTL